MRSILTIVAITLTTFSAYGVEVEMLINPGFEDGVLDPWATDSWTIDTTNPHTGDYCAVVDGYHYIEQAFTPTNVDDITSITFWAMQAEAVYVYIYLYYEGINTPDFIFSNIYDTVWGEHDVTSFLRDEGSLRKIRIDGYSGISPDLTYLDDASIMYEDGTTVESASMGSIKAAFK